MSTECVDALLQDILEPLLRVNEIRAWTCMRNDPDRLITTTSRLAIALIILGDGRNTECMRTHDVAPTTVKYIFHGDTCN